LFMLILSHVASPNFCIMVMSVSTYSLIGLRNTTTSSTYKDRRSLAVWSLSGVRSPSCVAFCKTCCKVSIVSMNRYNDNVSPCLSPRLCLIHWPGVPFSLTAEEEVVSSRDSQFRRRLGKPLSSRSSSRYFHYMESNALDISNLNSSIGVFLR
jgi:hypothetical protein